MSKARRKGTDYENFLMERYLSQPYPQVSRAPLSGINDKGDFINVGPWVMEAKKRNRWDLPLWIETTARKAFPSRPWAIWFAGDKRSGRNRDDYVVTTAATFAYLLEMEQVALDYMDEV